MAYDFRANQVRLNRIISSGSIPIIIYPASSATNFQGGKNFPDPGSDVFLFVSGSSTAKTAFGGDVVVSGSLANGQDLTITGLYSHAEGVSTIATGIGSHAEGLGNFAGGDYSHVEGNGNAAYAYGAHAEGNGAQAWAQNSHAEGNGTRTYGLHSHAEGWGSETYGTGSFAVGLYTIASGAIDGAFPPTTTQAAFGKYNLPNNTTSLLVVGDGLDASNRHDVLRVESGSVEVTGSFKVLGGITGSLSGTISGNPFIVAGSNITTNYNSLGQWEITGSAGGGSNFWTELDATTIYTTSSVRVAALSASLGVIITGSFIQGQPGFVFATGTNAFAHGGWYGSGIGVEARGNYSHAEGISTVATGIGSHAEGDSTQAQDLAAHSEGAGTLASGTASHTEGYQTTAESRWSHAEGYQTHARGDASHTEGNNTITTNTCAHAEGINTTAAGLYSHTEGNSTQTTDDGAHAEGYNTQATNKYAHAEGDSTVAAGRASHAGGLETEAHADYQTVVGRFNVASNATSLFVVGDGASSGTRHDILRVNTGCVEVTGSLAVNGGITGSLRYTNNTTPYLVGSGITVNYNGLGQYELSASGGTINNSTTVTGDGTNRGSGSIGGLFGIAGSQIGKYEVQVVAMESTGVDSAAWKFSVSAFSSSLNTFSMLGVNELTFDHTSNAASWDVNFNDSGQIEVTGSTGGTFFYTQITAKMIASYGSVIF